MVAMAHPHIPAGLYLVLIVRPQYKTMEWYSMQTKETRRQDAIRGSLLGGAIGDALGYAVEFLGEKSIIDRYGDAGICAFDPDPVSGKALISDDTQMTLFTANGLLFGYTRGAMRGIMAEPENDVACAYQDWLRTQTTDYNAFRREENDHCVSWLADVPELYSRRAPGNTCLSALMQGKHGETKANNNSKGCGGVMRVAPMGLIRRNRLPIEEADRCGAAFAAITHGHPLGWLPAALLVHIVRRIVYDRREQTLRQIVEDARDTVARLYAQTDFIDDMTALLNRAIDLSQNADSDLVNIHRLGEGWVGDEALAIAVYCALRYPNDFSAGIIAAVNHKGDSDSTGAVAGNILGAWVGYDAIEPKWKEDLELRDVLLEMADDLYTGCPIDEDTLKENSDWVRKYIDCRRPDR